MKIISILSLCLALLLGAILTASPASAQEVSKQNGQVDWDEKETEFLEALKATQGDHSEPDLHQAMGYWLLESDNQWERAAVHFEKAVESDPTLYRSWYGLGLIYIGSDKGNEYFRKTIKANPNYPPPYYWLAYGYCRYGKNKEAIPLLEKYLEVATKENSDIESARSEVAKKLLKELRSGKDGEELQKIRLTK